LAEKRTYELVVILEPKAAEDFVSTFDSNIKELVEKQGGTIVNVNDMGVRKLAYKIEKFYEGRYFVYEIDGSGQEVAELERRLRVNDAVIRFMTIRVDLERRRADKFKNKRTAKAERRGQAKADKRAEAQAAASEE
jgi:small subunit ribosomal protein S6